MERLGVFEACLDFSINQISLIFPGTEGLVECTFGCFGARNLAVDNGDRSLTRI